MTALAAQLELESLPNFPTILQNMQNRFDDERKKRLAFYEWVEPDMKAEFINGEIIENSPSADEHSDAVTYLLSMTHIFVLFAKLGKVKSEKAMVTLTRNDYEPDIAFWKKEKSDLFRVGQLHYPAPDLAVEILSKSTKNRDFGVKFDDYAQHGVAEYWIIDPLKHTIEQYILPQTGEKTFELHKKLAVGDFIESTEMTGFRIPVAAVFDEEINKLTILELMKK
jgi:Uma2 family endonuclease